LRDISLHILDLVENSIRAGASVICVSVEEEPVEDSLSLTVEDDGPGLPVSA
jgi:signal transduction histidine kinase